MKTKKGPFLANNCISPAILNPLYNYLFGSDDDERKREKLKKEERV
jgi:hypothetical protein